MKPSRVIARAWAAVLIAMLTACNRGAASRAETQSSASLSPVARNDEGPPGGEASPESAVPVRTATLRFGTIPEMASAYGTVSGGSNSQVSLAFTESGRIASVDVTVGAHVEPGQVLARLDTRPFEAEVAQASAALGAAEANARRTALGARPQLVAQTDAQIQQARTQLAVARAQLERQQKLLALGIASQSDVDAARSAVAAAQSQRKVLQEQRVMQVRPWQPDVQVANAGVAQARAALAGAQQKIALAHLVAPFSGAVVARLRNDGESAEAGQPVVQVASDDAPVFTAQFAPLDAARIHPGDLASVRPQGAMAESLSGRVVAINPAQGEARSTPVLIRLAARLVWFGPGAYGQASVQVGARRGLIVPKAAIVSDAATGSVQIFRREGERYTPVPVTIIAAAGQRAIVSGPGLRPGTVVAGEGAAELVTPQHAPKGGD